MKYLFVGGPADGEWRETDGEGSIHVRSTRPFVAGESKESVQLPLMGLIPASQESTRYRIRTWSAGTRLFYVYTPDGDSDIDTLTSLLKGYKP